MLVISTAAGSLQGTTAVVAAVWLYIQWHNVLCVCVCVCVCVCLLVCAAVLSFFLVYDSDSSSLSLPRDVLIVHGVCGWMGWIRIISLCDRVKGFRMQVKRGVEREGEIEGEDDDERTRKAWLGGGRQGRYRQPVCRCWITFPECSLCNDEWGVMGLVTGVEKMPWAFQLKR